MSEKNESQQAITSDIIRNEPSGGGEGGEGGVRVVKGEGKVEEGRKRGR